MYDEGMALRAALYCRLSSSTDTNEPGLDAQETELRQLAADRGWQIVEVIRERESAFRNVGAREGFARLAALVRDDAVDFVAARHPDRFSRDEVESALFRQDLRAHGVTMSTLIGDVNPDSPADALLATMTAGVAQYESALRQQRLLLKHADLARRGQPKGGGSRCYGYENDGSTIRESEAAHLRECAANIITGSSVRSEARRLREAGVTGTGGVRPIEASNLARLLRSARISGRREHHGEITADGSWPGIIDADTSDTLRSLLTPQPKRRYQRRTYMLSGGLVRCGRCGAKMSGRAQERRRYFCAKDRGGCNGTQILADPVEEIVSAAVIALVDSDRLSALTVGDGSELIAELRSLEVRQGVIVAAFARGDVSQSLFDDAAETMGEQRRRVESELSKLNTPDPLAGVDGALAEAWAGLDIDRRGAILKAAIESVVINPQARRGSNKFDTDRVTINWRS